MAPRTTRRRRGRAAPGGAHPAGAVANLRDDGPGRGAPDGPRGATPETEALHRAAAHCNAAFAYCATDAHDVQDLEDLLCLADCAQMCTVTADFIARGSPYAAAMRRLCFQQCQDSAATCDDYRADEVLAACGAALRDACDALSGHLRAAS